MSDAVSLTEEWVLGPADTPFFTTTWAPKSASPTAYILFVHGFAEHIARYFTFFTTLASPPYSLHITAFDQRGHGRTSMAPLTAASPEVVSWRKEGKAVKLEKGGKRRTGGWARVMPDIEWFVKRESGVAKTAGKRLFLWGFSMGGGEVLAFVTRPSAPPARETVDLLSGVIAGGPLIRQTHPASSLQVKGGSALAGVGLGNFLIPTPLKYEHLSHNPESNERCRLDPFCEQVGSLRGVADMLNGGITLDTSVTWNAWPKGLPLLLYHGEDDPICDVKATQRFHDGVQGPDKHIEVFKGMLHEVHNELEPMPSKLAEVLGGWIKGHVGGSSGVTPTMTFTAPSPTVAEGTGGQSKL